MQKVLLALFVVIGLLQAGQLGINERLGEMVPLDLTFLDEKSNKVTLKKMMEGKPTIITMNYFRCPGICTPQLEDLSKTLGQLDLAENTDYKVLTISFAEDETPALAASKRKNHVASIQREYVADAWHFLIGENNSSGILSKKLGFGYEKTVAEDGRVDYTHAAALIILSPEGKITRYLNGIDQSPIDVELAIGEASRGEVRPTRTVVLDYCFAYDPKSKTYIFAWEKIVATIMLAIVLGLFIYLLITGRRADKKKMQDHHNKGEIDE